MTPLFFTFSQVCTWSSPHTDNTDMLPCLDVEDEEEANDWLYRLIADIITSHNQIIEDLYYAIEENEHLSLSRLLPAEPAKISPLEVTSNNAIVGNFSEYVYNY